jgi:hypothetical protein
MDIKDVMGVAKYTLTTAIVVGHPALRYLAAGLLGIVEPLSI